MNRADLKGSESETHAALKRTIRGQAKAQLEAIEAAATESPGGTA